MSRKDLTSHILESNIFFSKDGCFFQADYSYDEREEKRAFSDNEEGYMTNSFNLWTGKYDDTYIAPPYVPDRGWINLSGKECDPIYWLEFTAYNESGTITKDSKKRFDKLPID